MAQIYTARQKRTPKRGGSEDVAAPAQMSLSGALDAIEHVQVHAGRRVNLDAAMAERMQEKFGIRMDQVELRESSQAAEMDAKAFAKGNVVQFAPGQFQPDTEHGQQLIQHELAHVAQQARGGVRADVPGLNVNANEGLEHQADTGGWDAGIGAPVSLSGLNAEAAPVQGAFGAIKRFFQKVGRSRRAGKALDERDQGVKEMTAQYNAEQDEITAAMKKQGYTDEEIQAQLMFQRVNQNAVRLEQYQDSLSAIRDSDVESPEEMDNFYARAARGAFRKKSREKRAKREEEFRSNVLAGDREYEQAEQMADKFVRRSEAEKVVAKNAGYSSEDMETVMAHTAPLVTDFIKAAAPTHGPTSANRFTFVRGNTREMQPYIKMLKRAGASVDRGMIEKLAEGVGNGPQGNYKEIKSDPERKGELAQFEDRALGDFDTYLAQVGQNADMMDALRQSADMYDSLGQYDAKKNIAGLVGGREEALHRGFNDMLLRSLFPMVGNSVADSPNRKQIVERANAMMGLQTSALAQSTGEQKEAYTEQQLAMRAKLQKFYRDMGLMP